ncbi:MAG: hypothetical protein VB072_18005, partial [Lentimicrobium sp.]|uniref:hypothetical protein n=1 Tax=Lentimicrobium sp. TaxID=2034841 RepID=UPI002B2133F2
EICQTVNLLVLPMMKFVGKPYAGKLHVRIDEGAGKAMCPSRSTLLAKIDSTSYNELPGNKKNVSGL